MSSNDVLQEVQMRKSKTTSKGRKEPSAESPKRRAWPLKEWCKSMGFSYDTGRRAMMRGALRTIRFGTLILVPAEEAERVMREGL